MKAHADLAAGSGEPIRRGLPRLVEVPIAIAALLAASPVLLLAAAAILLADGMPIVFRQSRVGRGGRAFVMRKFRTMRPSARGPAVTAGDDCRITPVGRFLRRTKVDELPELWNVVRGEMALVGPRPEVAEYVDQESPLWRQILEARPGLTDPVTVRLRNEEALLASAAGDRERYYREVLLPWKLQGQLRYLRSRTAWTDLGVLAKTAVAILKPASRRPTESVESPPELL